MQAMLAAVVGLLGLEVGHAQQHAVMRVEGDIGPAGQRDAMWAIGAISAMSAISAMTAVGAGGGGGDGHEGGLLGGVQGQGEVGQDAMRGRFRPSCRGVIHG